MEAGGYSAWNHDTRNRLAAEVVSRNDQQLTVTSSPVIRHSQQVAVVLRDTAFTRNEDGLAIYAILANVM